MYFTPTTFVVLGFFVETTSALLRTNFIIGLQQTPLDICLQYYGVSATVETCFLQFALDMSLNQKISSLKAAPRGYIKAEYRYIPRRLIFLSRKKMLERKYNEQKNGWRFGYFCYIIVGNWMLLTVSAITYASVHFQVSLSLPLKDR